jgi:hypothetical protein
MDAGTDVLTTKDTEHSKNAVFVSFVPFVVYILVAASLRQVHPCSSVVRTRGNGLQETTFSPLKERTGYRILWMRKMPIGVHSIL